MDWRRVERGRAEPSGVEAGDERGSGTRRGREATQFVDERGTVCQPGTGFSSLSSFSFLLAARVHRELSLPSLVTAVQPAPMIRETIHGIRGRSGLQWFTVSQSHSRFSSRRFDLAIKLTNTRVPRGRYVCCALSQLCFRRGDIRGFRENSVRSPHTVCV